jgi:hypothetical protein
MPGVPRELVEHRIDVNKGSKPVKQWLRRLASKSHSSIEKEHDRMVYVRRLHGSQQALPKGPVWIIVN